MATLQYAIPGLVVGEGDDVRLVGSRCRRCGTVAFPAVRRCNNPGCDGARAEVSQELLGPRGTVWSWTTIRVPVPAPFRREGDGPYPVAMVNMPEGLRIIGLLDPTANVSIGTEVVL